MNYDDIIDKEHPVSKHHPQMPLADRAAQFAPFAALTGFDGVIKETARLTDERIVLDEDARALLDEKLRIVKEQLGSEVEFEFTYFRADERKTGGSYISVLGAVKRIDEYEHLVILQDGSWIPIEDIVEITGEGF